MRRSWLEVSVELILYWKIFQCQRSEGDRLKCGLNSFLGGNGIDMSVAHLLKLKCATDHRQGHLSGTASADFDRVGPRQLGERSWPECQKSKTC